MSLGSVDLERRKEFIKYHNGHMRDEMNVQIYIIVHYQEWYQKTSSTRMMSMECEMLFYPMVSLG